MSLHSHVGTSALKKPKFLGRGLCEDNNYPWALPMAKQIKLTDFEMRRTLGCGSFGRVKLAKWKQDGKLYAVKFMKKHEIIKFKAG